MINYYYLTPDSITVSVKLPKKRGREDIIKYKLFCEINTYLANRYALYDFSTTKHKYGEEFVSSMEISAFPKKYLYLYNLDDDLITFKEYEEKEIREQHRILDPKVDYAYFKELYAMGSIDMEYFAVDKSIDFETVFRGHLNGTSRKKIVNAIKKMAEVYISIWDSDGMWMSFRNKEIYSDILEIVKKHCIERPLDH